MVLITLMVALLLNIMLGLLNIINRYNPVAGFPFGGGSWRNSQPPLEVAHPAVLPQAPQRGLQGHHDTGNLAVFLNNRGEVTAYTSSGHKLWQARL